MSRRHYNPSNRYDSQSWVVELLCAIPLALWDLCVLLWRKVRR